MDRRLKQARRAYFSEPTLNSLQYYRLKRYARRAGHHLEVIILRGHTIGH